jgi:hypothetical protein
MEPGLLHYLARCADANEAMSPSNEYPKPPFAVSPSTRRKVNGHSILVARPKERMKVNVLLLMEGTLGR